MKKNLFRIINQSIDVYGNGDIIKNRNYSQIEEGKNVQGFNEIDI